MSLADQAVQRLMDGNERFVKGKLLHPNQDQSRKNEVLGGQDPFAVVLSCADSRVVPELIFDTGIGDLFVVRVAGNVANTSSIASIEYAVAHLNPSVVLVLGHESCGAVNAALDTGDRGPNLDHLLSQITPAVKEEERDDPNLVARRHARNTARELQALSTIIRSAVHSGKTEIKAAFYHLATGKVEFLAD